VPISTLSEELIIVPAAPKQLIQKNSAIFTPITNTERFEMERK
jgi:hypothetical protein